MPNKIQHKRSAVASSVPLIGDIDLGEFAINTKDGKVFIKKNVNDTDTIVEIGGAGLYTFEIESAVTIGDALIINDSNRVEPVALQSSKVSSPNYFYTGKTERVAISYDMVEDKILAVYSDHADVNYYGWAVVGTVLSDGSITWGTRVEFNHNGTTGIDVAYDANSGKHVIVYRDVTVGRAIVATVNGDTVSFGSEVNFTTNGSYNSITYDASIGKCIITTYDSTDGIGFVCTVVGTTPSFSSGDVFDADNCATLYSDYNSDQQVSIVSYWNATDSATYVVAGSSDGSSVTYGTPVSVSSSIVGGDSAIVSLAGDKFAVVYKGAVGQSYYGYCRIGTLVGTTITLGTEVVFSTVALAGGGAVPSLAMSYDPVNDKLIVFYSSTTKGYANEATISGTTPTFGTSIEINADDIEYLSALFDPVKEVNVIAFQNTWFSYDYGVAKTYNTGLALSNMTSGNYLGIAQSTAPNFADIIEVATDGVMDTNQTGLVSGETYYVDRDGSISATDTTGVEAGLGINYSTLLVSTENAPEANQVATIAEMEEGVEPAIRAMSPLGVKKAIEAATYGTPMFISGLIGTTISSTSITISPGVCAASNTGERMEIISAFTKTCNATWVAGSGNGGALDGNLYSNISHHLFVIMKDDDGSIDLAFDNNITCTNIPAGYTSYRRIASFTSGTSILVSQNQMENDELFLINEVAGGGVNYTLKTPALDVDTSSNGTTAITLSVEVPSGVAQQWNFSARTNDTATTRLRVFPYGATDAVVTSDNQTTQSSAGATNASLEGSIITDSADTKYGRVKYRADASFTSLKLKTLGWTDFRRD